MVHIHEWRCGGYGHGYGEREKKEERGNEEERGGGETKSLNQHFSQMTEGFENGPKEYEEEMREERLKS